MFRILRLQIRAFAQNWNVADAKTVPNPIGPESIRATGELSPGYGLTLSSIVLSAGKAFELSELAGRLEGLEHRLRDIRR